MRNEIEKFHHTIGVLVKAYLNDTLSHRSCKACAVGNIIEGNGYKLKDHDHGLHWYRHVVCRSLDYSIWLAEEQISVTGYKPEELRKIEFAFEYSDRGNDWNLSGLMAVVDVLAEIHGIDLSTREETKKLFVKEN